MNKRGPFDTPGTPPPTPAPMPAPPAGERISLSVLATLPDYGGIHFDPSTGKTYREDGSYTGFTFERARWSGPFGIDFSWPWLNPISFATAETAERVFQWARRALPVGARCELDDTSHTVGPFTRTVERAIVVIDPSGRQERFSAGWLANSIIRNGESRARDYWQAELLQAELRF